MSKGPDAYRTIGEASKEVGVEPYVLRFWETKFSQLRPVKRSGGRRFYRPSDIDKLRVIKSLLKEISYPLAATRANISKGISPISKEDVKDEFGKKIKFVLDGGRSKIGLESTIISLIKKPEILRLGGLEIGIIQKILKIKKPEF